MKWHTTQIATFSLILVLSGICFFYGLVLIPSRYGYYDRYISTSSHKYSVDEESKKKIVPKVYPQKLCELDRYNTDVIDQPIVVNCCRLSN